MSNSASRRVIWPTHNLPVAGVVEAVIAGIREGSRDFNVEARLIGIMSRTFGEAACLQELEALLAHRDGITALDLAGDELGFPGSLFLPHFNRARCRLAHHRACGRSRGSGEHLASNP